LSLAPAALAQAPRDTLQFHVALLPQRPHLSVEARLTAGEAGAVALSVPPAARRAGVEIQGFLATDDRGRPLRVTRRSGGYLIQLPEPGALRFRYRAEFERRVADGSTSAGFDSTRLYAVTRSLFVAPDPDAYRKTSRAYPVLRVRFAAPPGWSVVTGWAPEEDEYLPADGDDLLGATLAAAPDFRLYRDSVGGSALVLAIRGRRYFADSALATVVKASLQKASRAFGPVPVPRVTYTSDLGRKGRTSGSLQGAASIGLMWEPGEVLELARTHDTFHETLHLWFGGALDTERWWTEGVTDYFAARLHAEWSGRPAELATLVWQSHRHYAAIPHNTRLTMAEEGRRRLPGDNTQLLVYRKGMLAGLLMDAAIRRERPDRSLDDVARRLLALGQQRRGRRVREAEIRAAVVEAGGPEAGRVFDRVAGGTALLSAIELRQALHDVTGEWFDAPAPPAGRKPRAT
jgi:predicted metalloprotease with PDZ domain